MSRAAARVGRAWCGFWAARVGRAWSWGPFSLAVVAERPVDNN